MLKVIAVSFIIFIIALLVEANIGVMWNMPGMGIIFAVVLMDGIILYSIEKEVTKSQVLRKKKMFSNSTHHQNELAEGREALCFCFVRSSHGLVRFGGHQSV